MAKRYRNVKVTTKLKTILQNFKDLDRLESDLFRYLRALFTKQDRIHEKVKKLIYLLETTEDEQKTGPVQVREEVVGTSSKAKNKNMGNSGFSGGQIARFEAA